MSNLPSRHSSVLARTQAIPTPYQERPLSIAWAECLLYFATILWLLRLIAEILNGTPAQTLLIPAILLAVQLMLIVGAIRGRSRLLLACLVIFCLGTILLDLIAQAIETRAYKWEPPRLRFRILRLMQVACEVVAFALLLSSRHGRRWFVPAAAEPRATR